MGPIATSSINQLKSIFRWPIYCGITYNITYNSFFSDMGTMDENGFIKVKGRKADMMRYKKFGDIVYPQPIESAAKSHPKVLEAKV